MTTGAVLTPAERPERIEILQSFDCGAKVRKNIIPSKKIIKILTKFTQLC